MEAIESLIQTLLALIGAIVAVWSLRNESAAKRARNAELEILRLQLESTDRDVKASARRRKRRRVQH